MAPKVPFSCRALLVSGIYYSDIGFLRVLAVRRLGFHAPHTPPTNSLYPLSRIFTFRAICPVAGFQHQQVFSPPFSWSRQNWGASLRNRRFAGCSRKEQKSFCWHWLPKSSDTPFFAWPLLLFVVNFQQSYPRIHDFFYCRGGFRVRIWGFCSLFHHLPIFILS